MFEDIQKFIPKVAGKFHMAKTLDAIEICNEYRKIAPAILPEAVINESSVKSYKDGKLTILAANSSCAQLLHMNKHRLHKGLSESFGDNCIKEIRIELTS